MANDTWRGKIESLAPDGSGIGIAHEHTPAGQEVRRPVFIPYTAPGDTVEATITGRKGKYAFGELLRVIEPSAERVDPYCPHFGVCGGCDLQHIAYDAQLREKARVIVHQLAKAGVALPHAITVLPSLERQNYRRRGRIAVRFEDGRAIAGFRKRRSRDVVPIGTCGIVAKQILDLIISLNTMDATPAELDGLEIELLVAVGDKGKLGLLARLDDIPPRNRALVRDWLETLYARDRKLVGNALVEENRSIRALGQVQEHFAYAADGLEFGFTPETFIQANLATDETLIERAMQFLTRGADAKGMTVIDLYAGIGNLSLPTAKRCARVIAVEGHESSVQVGRANAIRNGIENVTFLYASTENYLADHERRSGQDEDHPIADAIIIDPPRTGLSPPARMALERTGAARIVYVSCDPVTLARDLQSLSGTYDLRDIVGIDMFPDISHVETVCLLERRA